MRVRTVSKTGMAAKSNHYNRGTIQPIDLIIAQQLGFCEGSIVKYICRYKHKGSAVQDLKKAQQYINWLIEIEEGIENDENRHN